MQAAPAIGRHQLGMSLRQLREAQSLRLEDAAAKLGVAPSTLCRIEIGQAPTKVGYLSILLDLYRVDDPERREQLMDMAAAGRRKDWWAKYTSLLSAETGTYLGLESVAEHVRGFAAHTVPALLQTPGYAQAFIRATRPELDATEVSALVALQVRRQWILDQAGRELDLVLDESVLLRSVGSQQVMAKQLAHLLTVTHKPSVTVRVIRLAAVRPVLSPSFTLLMLPDAADAGIACLESTGGQIDISRRVAEIDTIRNMFEVLTESALSPASSAELISRYAGGFS